MVNRVLIPGKPYEYVVEEGVRCKLTEYLADLWYRAWLMQPGDVAQSSLEFLDSGGFQCRPMVAFVTRDNATLNTFAKCLRNDCAFMFKAEVLELFSQDSIMAIYGHEFAHVYLRLTGDPDHIFPLINRAEIERCEAGVDSLAKVWGFSIDECRAEETCLRAKYPEMFGRPPGI